MARYINLDDVVLKGICVFDENLDLLIPLSDVRKALQMTPTADVVPKSEVVVANFATTKREIAREIFEEIEDGIKAAISALQFANPTSRKIKHETLLSLMRFIKTIEKKYTEGEHEP